MESIPAQAELDSDAYIGIVTHLARGDVRDVCSFASVYPPLGSARKLPVVAFFCHLQLGSTAASDLRGSAARSPRVCGTGACRYFRTIALDEAIWEEACKVRANTSSRTPAPPTAASRPRGPA